MVKRFLDEQGVEYEFRDVLADEAAARQFQALGGRVPPLTLVGRQAIHGFRPEAIEAALALADEDRSPS